MRSVIVIHMPSSKEGKAKQKRDIHIWNCPENIHVCTPAEWTVQMNWEPVSARLDGVPVLQTKFTDQTTSSCKWQKYADSHRWNNNLHKLDLTGTIHIMPSSGK